jgi:hypothetical protein
MLFKSETQDTTAMYKSQVTGDVEPSQRLEVIELGFGRFVLFTLKVRVS